MKINKGVPITNKKLLILLLLSLLPWNFALANSSLTNMRTALEAANAEFYRSLQDVGIEDQTILNLQEYKYISESLAETLAVYKGFSNQVADGKVAISPRKQKDLDKLLSQLVYYTNSGRLLMVVLSHPALATVMSELPNNTNKVNQSFVRQIIRKTQMNFQTAFDDEDRSTNQSYGNLYDSVNLAKQWKLSSRPAWLNEYVKFAKDIMMKRRYLSSRHFSNEAHKEFFYELMSGLLYLTGKVALPKSYFISVAEINEVQEKLLPGDIAVIKHMYKLTNIAFKGEWSHGLVYLGSWEKLKHYFDRDSETKRYFTQKCREQKLSCSSFSGFLEKSMPDVVSYYRSVSPYKGHDLPRVVLESKGEGVIISNLYDGLMKDQLAVLRPKMSKKAKAISIFKALEFVNRPYDYNFSLHSRSQLVCTEIIYNVYSPGAGPGIPNFNWHISYVMGKPVNYASDLVKTFAQYYGSNKQALDFLLFLKADKEKSRVTKASVQDLIRTVND